LKILIAGLAKTGTTGLLYLIANSFKKEPRLLFEPKKCPPGLRRTKADVVGKILISPRLDAASFAHFDRKITIVRDPRDRLVSALLYSQYHATYVVDDARIAGVRECLERKEADPRQVSIREILGAMSRAAGKGDVEASFRSRAVHALNWLDQYMETMPDGLPYHYEKFVSGDYAQLERHLGMRLGGAAKVPDRMNRVERTKGYGDWRHWFTPEDVERYRPLFAPWLAKHGYDPDDWRLEANPAIAREHCSGYFMRLVAEYREKKAGKLPAKPTRQMTGRILKARPHIVVGWAIGPDPAKPVRVALRVNGRELAQTVANRPRPPLKHRGIHPTGHCGFAFELGAGEPLKVGDEVAVSPVDAEFALADSPMRVEPA
jgi:hypothetical protein